MVLIPKDKIHQWMLKCMGKDKMRIDISFYSTHCHS